MIPPPSNGGGVWNGPFFGRFCSNVPGFERRTQATGEREEQFAVRRGDPARVRLSEGLAYGLPAAIGESV